MDCDIICNGFWHEMCIAICSSSYRRTTKIAKSIKQESAKNATKCEPMCKARARREAPEDFHGPLNPRVYACVVGLFSTATSPSLFRSCFSFCRAIPFPSDLVIPFYGASSFGAFHTTGRTIWELAGFAPFRSLVGLRNEFSTHTQSHKHTHTHTQKKHTHTHTHKHTHTHTHNTYTQHIHKHAHKHMFDSSPATLLNMESVLPNAK